MTLVLRYDLISQHFEQNVRSAPHKEVKPYLTIAAKCVHVVKDWDELLF